MEAPPRAAAPVVAQKENIGEESDVKISEERMDQSLAAAQKLVSTPAGYLLRDARLEAMDEVPVWVYRFEKANGENSGLGGEHFSLVVNAETDTILGFTKMDGGLAEGDLPSRDEARRVAMETFDSLAPGLAPTLQVQWIEPHEETLLVEGGSVTITGMKVKCRQNSGKYAWVIVGPGGDVITFEREIIWDSGMSRRATQKWLHDSWLLERS